MFEDYKIKEDTGVQECKLSILRITALWAFSESTLGGLLHAFKIPFTGFFIGGTAVLFISLIAKYSDNKSEILRSTIIVMIIKAIISPHTPLTAFFAVLVQGLLGQLLFYNKRFFELSALVLGISALLLSALQKVIILTFLFGNTLWESIDVFADHVMKQFGVIENSSVNFSWILIGGYITLHLLGGIIFGIIAGRLPKWIEKRISEDYQYDRTLISNFTFGRKRKKPFWEKPTTLIFIFFLSLFLLFSLTDETFGVNQLSKVIIMLIRSVIVMTLWFFLISPLLLKLFHKLLKQKMARYSAEIDEIVNIFPQFRHIIALSWKKSSAFNGINKFRYFLSYSFILLLLSGTETNE